MNEDTAMHHFRGPARVNCAQAVLLAFQGALPVSDAMLQAAKGCGGGRAPEGECGAYHAARLLLKDHPQALAELRQRFEDDGGDIRCRSIRQARQLDCDGCVKLAARVVAGVM